MTTYANGATTSGSLYPRTELRELDGDGNKASWGLNTGQQRTLTFSGRVTRLTPKRPKVVIAQVKGADDEPLELRVESNSDDRMATVLARFLDTGNTKILDKSYVLSSYYSVTISVFKGKITVSYKNDGSKVSATVSNTFSKPATSGCYFKVGNYLQSNTKYDRSSASSEVELTSLDIS